MNASKICYTSELTSPEKSVENISSPFHETLLRVETGNKCRHDVELTRYFFAHKIVFTAPVYTERFPNDHRGNRQ